MKSKKISVLIKIFIGVVLPLLVLSTLGCKFFTGGAGGTAAPHLTVKGAPSNITSLSLIITGPGMSPIESYYSSVPSSITVEVPAGNDRQFELIAHVDPSSPSAATSFKGTATVDLAPGEKKNITLNMITNETKLLIPDPSWSNNRLVQIDNMNGNGWIEVHGTDIGYGADSEFEPYDVDFDAQGRIYIANNHFFVGGVIRIDNMNYAPYDTIVNQIGVRSIAIDRVNNDLYYITYNDLYRKNLDGGAPITLTVSGLEISFEGIAIDDDGLIYIANDGGDEVVKYNPLTETVIKQVGVGSIPWDVIVKSPFVYVARYDSGGANDKIIQLTKTLDIVDELPGKPDSTDDFRGPHRFIAILNKRIYVIDEDESAADIERIVAFDDINGTNWDTFDPSMLIPPESAFLFYNVC